MICSWPIHKRVGDEEEFISAYGREWPVVADIAIELAMFRENAGINPDVAYHHLKNAHHTLWPSQHATYHEWTVDRFKAFSEGHRVVSLAGGGGIAKSADVAKYALLWWWAQPDKRAVIVGSTTLDALMKRIWGYISKYRHLDDALGMPGNISQSKPPKILYSKTDTMHGIFGFALKDGKTDKTLSDVIGIHPDEGLLVVIDEATDVTPAIEDAITNWKSGGITDDYFHMIVMGNSKSKLDPHGRLCKPVRGWSSVNPDVDTRWDTENGVCLYFDCYKSPAIIHKDNPRLRFLWTEEKIEAELKRLGPDHPNFQRFVRGFWPAENLEKTVLTPTLIERHNAQGKAEFSGQYKIRLAALDPAFTSGGDNCVMRFADFGMDTRGFLVLQFDPTIHYMKINGSSKEPVSYQVVRMAREMCEQHNIKPEHFALDTWGFGLGAGDIIYNQWSDKVHRVISIGAPSQMAIDSEMARTAAEMFDRRITELWWMMREAVMSNQIFGLDDITVEQLCSREYEWKGRMIRLEGKEAYKRRMGKEQDSQGSPDEADAACIMLDLARTIGFRTAPRADAAPQVDSWDDLWVPPSYRGEKRDPHDPDSWDDGFMQADDSDAF